MNVFLLLMLAYFLKYRFIRCCYLLSISYFELVYLPYLFRSKL